MPAALDLRRMQGLFWSLITAPEGVRPALDALARKGELERPSLDDLFTGDERMPAADRLDIYANMYFFRLLDCLREDYPKVAAVLGGDRFHNLVTDYLLRHPSDRPDLRHLGRHLPGFVATHDLSAEYPYLSDLARLEWARADVFDAADAQPIGREELSRLPQDRAGEARLGLIPAFELLRFEHDVVRVWRGLEEAGPEGQAMQPRDGNSASKVGEHDGCGHAAPPRIPHDVRRRKTAARIWRHRFIVYHRSVDEEEARCLDLARAGESLGGICQRIAAGRSLTKATARVGRMLQTWIEDGVLADVTLPA
jgi:Putative DNA-binding domain